MTETNYVDLTLLSNFLHQVINPLNGVCGTLDNILEGQVPPGHQTQRLRAARAQLEHCITLTRNLAFLSQFATDPAAFKTKPKICVIPQVIIEAMMFFQEVARSKKMNIKLDDPKTQYKVEGEPDLLRQVFMNLFDNGVKYGRQGTDIHVVTKIQIRTSHLIVELTGESTPVPREQRERMFELGFRGDNARQVVASGTGLGLYICRMIVEQLFRGQITYSTRKNATESVFTVKIPGVWL